MITFSLMGVIAVLLKIISVILIMVFGALIILWPVNDKPISITQKIVFAVFSIVTALIVFGVIQFTA